jgi:hypothetical protein
MGIMVFSGCSPGDDPLNISGEGWLGYGDLVFNSGQYADLKPATATRDGYVVVGMNRVASNSMRDPAVRVVRGHCTTPAEYNISYSNYGYLATNDDYGGTLDARAMFSATKKQKFTVAFTSYATGDTGYYSWRINETSSASSVRTLDQDTSVEKTPVLEIKDGELIAE